MASIDPEKSYSVIATSLYALGMSHPGADRVEVEFGLCPTFEPELSGGDVGTEAWAASVSLGVFAFRQGLPEEEIHSLSVEGDPEGDPSKALCNLQGKIRELLSKEVVKAEGTAAKLETLVKAL